MNTYLEFSIVAVILIILVVTLKTFRLIRNLIRKLDQVSSSVNDIAPFVWATTTLSKREGTFHPLPNWNDWSIPPDTLNYILEIIDNRNPKLVVEFGAGISTIVIASKLAETGGKLVSFEHDSSYADHVRDLLEARGLQKSVEFRVSKMTEGNFKGYDHPWYDLDVNDLPANVNLVVVDGPPRPLGEKIRMPAGDLMAERLAPGGTIIFDDAARAGEQAIKYKLMEKYDDYIFSEPPSIRGVLIMTKAD